MMPGSPRAASGLAQRGAAGSAKEATLSKAGAAGGMRRRLHSAYALRASGVRGALFVAFAVAGYLLFDLNAGASST